MLLHGETIAHDFWEMATRELGTAQNGARERRGATFVVRNELTRFARADCSTGL